MQAAQTCAAGQLQLLTCQDACRPRSENSPAFRTELETLATRIRLQPCSQPSLPHGERGLCCWTQPGVQTSGMLLAPPGYGTHGTSP